MIFEAANPDPRAIPQLGVWERGKELMVSSGFSNVPLLICDSWCYESAVDFVEGKRNT